MLFYWSSRIYYIHTYILYVRTVTYIYLLYLEVIITVREWNIFTEQRMFHLKIMSSDISAILKYKKNTHIPCTLYLMLKIKYFRSGYFSLKSIIYFCLLKDMVNKICIQIARLSFVSFAICQTNFDVRKCITLC